MVDGIVADDWSGLPLAHLRRLDHFEVDTDVVVWDPEDFILVQGRLLHCVKTISRSIEQLTLNFHFDDQRLAIAEYMLSERSWSTLDECISRMPNLQSLGIVLDIGGIDLNSQALMSYSVRRSILDQLSLSTGKSRTTVKN